MNIKHDRDEVLKIGMGLLCQQGYNSLGIDEICKTTGMTKGAFYNAFKSKEQFLLEAIRLYGDNNVARIQKVLAADKKKSAFERWKAFYITMLEVQPKAGFVGCLVNNIMSELGVMNEGVGKASTEEYNRFIAAIEPTVKQAQKEGSISNKLSAKAITELVHATFYGALTIAKSAQSSKQSISTMNLLFNHLKNTNHA